MKPCAYCGDSFESSRGRVYCSDYCRDLAAAEAAEQRRNKARIARRKARNKSCIVCGAKLSIYGDGNTCASCIAKKPLTKILKDIKGRR